MCEYGRCGRIWPAGVVIRWLLMIAQVAYPLPTAAAAGVPPQGSGESGAQQATEPRWEFPPVRWGGSLVNEFRQQRADDQAKRRQIVDIVNMRVGSYVWQPWFAQVAGGASLLTSREHADSSGASGGPQSGRSSSATGNGTLALFPSSRFPFQALFDVSDSRASGELTRSDFTSTRLGLRQNYQTLRGDANYTGSYDRSTLRSSGFGTDTVDVFAAGMAKQAGEHTYDITGSRTRNQRARNGEGSLLNRVSGRHSYRPEPTLSVESLASLSTSDFRLANSSGTFSETATRFLQLNTFATWRPEEGDPLFVTGGGRVFQSVLQTNGAESESRSLNGYVSANYAVNRNLSVAGSASVAQATAAGSSSLFSSQTGTVTYLPDMRQFGDYIYTQNLTATVANQTGGREGGRQNAGGQAGHTVTRSFGVRENSVVSVSLGQNLASNYDTATAASETLAHNATMSWRLSPSSVATTYFGITALDSRTRGHNQNEFQLINAQATGQMQFGRYAYAGANLTTQGTRQQMPSAPAAPFNWNTNGNLNYQHVRAFGVAGLRYYAFYSINETQYRTRLQGDINAPRDRVSQAFEQRLLYNIGRVEVRLTARVAIIEGARNSLIFLRVSRQIGNF